LPPAYVYPLQWLARMPLAAHFVASSRTDEALTQWQLLLDSRQHLLPDPLRAAIECALLERDRGSNLTGTSPSVLLVTQLSQAFRYI
jgi:hypothetical protein